MKIRTSSCGKALQVLAFVVCLASCSPIAHADLIIGNLPLTGQWVGMSITNHLRGWKYYEAEGFTIGNDPVLLTDVVLNLSLGGWGIPIFPPLADLYSDDNGFLGTHLTGLEPVIRECFPCDISEENYVFLPQTPIIMQPHETYWIRASVADQGFYYWNASTPDQVPVGPYATATPQQWTFFRGFWETHQQAFGGPINMGYEVHGTATPEAGTVLLLVIGLFWIVAAHLLQGEPNRTSVR